MTEWKEIDMNELDKATKFIYGNSPSNPIPMGPNQAKKVIELYRIYNIKN